MTRKWSGIFSCLLHTLFFQGLGKLNLSVANISELFQDLTLPVDTFQMKQALHFFILLHRVCIYLLFFFKISSFCLAYQQDWDTSFETLMAEKLLPGCKSQSSGCLQFCVFSPSSTAAVPLSLPHPEQYCSLSSIFPGSCR